MSIGHGRITLPIEPSIGSLVSVDAGPFEKLLLWKPRIGEALSIAGPEGVYRARLKDLSRNSASLLVFERSGVVADCP